MTNNKSKYETLKRPRIDPEINSGHGSG